TSEVVLEALNQIIDDPTMRLPGEEGSSDPANRSGDVGITSIGAVSSADEALIRLSAEVESRLSAVGVRRGVDLSPGLDVITGSLVSQAVLGEYAASGLARLVELGHEARAASVDPAVFEIVRDRGELALRGLDVRLEGWDPNGP